MHEHLLGAAVVGDAEAGFLLDHGIYFARSSTSATRQRLVLLSGRVSITRTLSPTLTSLVSSWAYSFLVLQDELVVLGVAHALDDGDDGGLVHLVRHDDALADLAARARVAVSVGWLR